MATPFDEQKQPFDTIQSQDTIHGSNDNIYNFTTKVPMLRFPLNIKYIMAFLGFKRLYPYIDDLIYVSLPSEIHQAYLVLLDLLAKLGLEISTQKLVQPTTSAVCLGIQVDTIAKTISIPSEKLSEIKNLCQAFVSKKTCTNRQLQSLLGSLLLLLNAFALTVIFLIVCWLC